MLCALRHDEGNVDQTRVGLGSEIHSVSHVGIILVVMHITDSLELNNPMMVK